MIVLGIETSCDETAAAVVADDKTVLAAAVLSQISEHSAYGGVVPEIAARAHVEHLDHLISAVMSDAGIGFSALDGVAATAGPGLIGGVMVGLTTGKAIAAVQDVPLVAVNHLEAHALSVRLNDEVAFPYLALLVSGGHTQLVIVEDVRSYRRLGTTIDDAAGEAFDKTAKLLGLGYPGGPAIEEAAAFGADSRFDLPRPLRGRPGCDFSFSGLKTAVRRIVEDWGEGAPAAAVNDLAAAFQTAVGDVLCDRSANAFDIVRDCHAGATRFVVAGGVAANGYLRDRLKALAGERGFSLIAPPPELCTDNGIMVAWAGIERLRKGLTDSLDVAPRARWPLDPHAAPQAKA
jgi:N6-L-threonylcarbamoyladenine synthase